MSNKDHILTQKLEQLKRRNTRTYICPSCGTTFHNERKLYQHGLSDHQKYFEANKHLVDPEKGRKEEEPPNRFCAQAQERGQQGATTRPAAAEIHLPLNASLESRRFSKGNGSGDNEDRHRSPMRTGSGPRNSPGAQKRIDDIGQLSLGQNTSRGIENQTIPIVNPRKRGAEIESRLSGPPISNHREGHTSARPRHGPTRLDGIQVLHQDDLPGAAEFNRGASGPKQPLFDPSSDPVKSTRKEKPRGHQNMVHHRGPSSGVQSTGQGLITFTKSHAPARHEGSDGQSKPAFPFGKDQEDQSSGSLQDDDSPEKDYPKGLDLDPEMLLQPETRPISTEQLVVEVKGIYAGLVMVEAKCIDIDERQSAAAQEKDPTKKPELTNDQWQSLIALHKQLLHEHHDFFLASQHPSASPALSKLAAKYSMPAQHMLAFIYIAYSMVALLYETVSAFEDTWVECLGDLGRYRMAIEDDEPRDREIWNNVAKFWYQKASDKTPFIGRLYHHLAILARPFTLEQLSLYARSLICVIPFESTKSSIMTLFNPVLQEKEAFQRIETLLIKAHALLFTGKSTLSSDRLDATMQEINADNLFEKYIVKCSARFKEVGQYIVTSAIAGLFEYGNAKDGKSKSGLRLAFEYTQIIKDQIAKASSAKVHGTVDLSPDEALLSELKEASSAASKNSSSIISYSSNLASLSLCVCLERSHDGNVYPLVHIHLVFIWSLVIVQEACKYFASSIYWKTIEKDTPWNKICLFLNDLADDTMKTISQVQHEEFPWPYGENGRPLPEDYIMRGQLFSLWYFPNNWFTSVLIDDDERSHDLPSMIQPRKERLLWLGHRIASAKRWIRFDDMKRRFSVTDYVVTNLTTESDLATVAGE
ncbi:hypothetical protein ACLMJK_002877 [Lecanora helva]